MAKFNVATNPVITVFTLQCWSTQSYKIMKKKTISVHLFVQSALPPAIKTHSSYQVKLQKEVKSTQNSQSVKKRAAHDSMKKFQIAEQQKYNRTNGSKFA